MTVLESKLNDGLRTQNPRQTVERQGFIALHRADLYVAVGKKMGIVDRRGLVVNELRSRQTKDS
ncbi:MAG: hypothetical protein ABSD70_17775 [Terracidiphilus sp.]